MSGFLLLPSLCLSGSLSSLPKVYYLHCSDDIFCSPPCMVALDLYLIFLLLSSCSKNGVPLVGDVIFFDSSSLEGSLLEDLCWKGQKLSHQANQLCRSETTWAALGEKHSTFHEPNKSLLLIHRIWSGLFGSIALALLHLKPEFCL